MRCNYLWILSIFALLFVSDAKPRKGDNVDTHFGETKSMHDYVHKQLQDMPDLKVEDEDDLYYYFSVHDYNNDGHLDGHELRSVILDGLAKAGLSLSKVEEMVDKVILEDDRDNDGTISWDEYLESIDYSGGDVSVEHTDDSSSTAAPKSIVENLINNHKIVMFSKSSCPYCHSAKTTFSNMNEEYHAFEIDMHSNGQAILDYLKTKTGRSTVPNIFINKKNIGGNDELQALVRNGKIGDYLHS